MDRGLGHLRFLLGLRKTRSNREFLDPACWLRSVTRIRTWNGTLSLAWSQGSPECLRCGPCRYIRIGDKECEFNKNFRLILHTKLANPHYKPELQAQTTLLNFTVTEDGLEAQLLAEVVSIERPDLERLKVNSTASSPGLTHPTLCTDRSARGWHAKWGCVTEENIDTYEKKTWNSSLDMSGS